ncbi:ABC transporter permease [Wukongibacter sp. M2B1]|uniref:ABC transporter permease n=1 Tax=Wukongibacter sp. M2B1 TaxID=3088895 RepID=UPI003D7922E8
MITNFIVEKIISKLIVFLVITLMAFILMNVSRIDPAESYVRRHATIPDQKVINELREEMGLNKPIMLQYINWLRDVSKLDFGMSLVTGNKVEDDIALHIKPTLFLVLVSLIIITVVATAFGVISAVYENTIIDRIIKTISLMGVSIPNFWAGFLLLYIFSLKLRLMPSISEVNLKGVLLPAITMALVPVSHYSRFLRANMLEELNSDYILNCYAKGLRRNKIIFIHALKNAVQPMIPLFFQNIGYLITGSAIIEAVFSWPGLGMYTLHAIIDRDFPVVVAYILLSAVIFSICSIAAEIVGVRINKRLMESRTL